MESKGGDGKSYIVPREKPKCYNCPFRTLDYCGLLIEHDCVTVNVNEMTVSKYCPLVEIPTPHGRLVDIKSVEDRKFTTVDNEYERWWNGALDSVVDNAPTVIEAERSEE